MPTPFLNSAGATYLDRDARIRELRAMVDRAAERIPEIRRVILFGSMVAGIPTPRSDADILVQVATRRHVNPRNRAADIMRALRPIAFPIDIFVYTTDELS